MILDFFSFANCYYLEQFAKCSKLVDVDSVDLGYLSLDLAVLGYPRCQI